MTSASHQTAELLQLDGTHVIVLATLHQEVFPLSPWSTADCVSLVSHPGTFGWLWLDPRGQPCAFLLARQTLNEVEILTFGVVEGCRRSGCGSTLLDTLLAEASERKFDTVVLEVAASNEAAVALYRKAGFASVGRRLRYYKTENGNEDAVLLRLQIEEEGA